MLTSLKSVGSFFLLRILGLPARLDMQKRFAALGFHIFWDTYFEILVTLLIRVYYNQLNNFLSAYLVVWSLVLDATIYKRTSFGYQHHISPIYSCAKPSGQLEAPGLWRRVEEQLAWEVYSIRASSCDVTRRVTRVPGVEMTQLMTRWAKGNG